MNTGSNTEYQSHGVQCVIFRIQPIRAINSCIYTVCRGPVLTGMPRCVPIPLAMVKSLKKRLPKVLPRLTVFDVQRLPHV